MQEKDIIFWFLFTLSLVSLYQIKSDVLSIDIIPGYHSPDLGVKVLKTLLWEQEENK
ncbi:MAG: hypothetical protein LDL41_02680 [Coleofasciculus sp. S288]|nr:hypothetical protein [Coleofasciculus sp. S288]